MDFKDASVGMRVRTDKDWEGVILKISDGMALIKWRRNNVTLWYGPSQFQLLHMVLPTMPEPTFTLEEINGY